MHNMFNRILMTIYRPAKVFGLIVENPSLKDALLIVILLFSSAIIRPLIDTYAQFRQQPIITYVIAISILVLLYLLNTLAFFIEALYLKLVLYIRGKKEKITKVAALIAYTMIPSIIYNIIIVIYPKFLVTTSVNGKIKVLYSKLCLGYFFHGISNQYPIIYNLIKSVNVFSVWSNVLEILAVGILCKVSYPKAIVILIPYWLFTSLMPILLLS